MPPSVLLEASATEPAAMGAVVVAAAALKTAGLKATSIVTAMTTATAKEIRRAAAWNWSQLG